MKLTKLTVRISERINVYGFESIEPSVELTADLEEGDLPQFCHSDLYDQTREMWKGQAMQMLKGVAQRRKQASPQKVDEIQYCLELIKAVQ